MTAQGVLIEELRAHVVTLQANEQRVHEELGRLRGRLVELCGVVGAAAGGGGSSSPEEEEEGAVGGDDGDGDRGRLSPPPVSTTTTTVVNDANRQLLLSPKPSPTAAGQSRNHNRQLSMKKSRTGGRGGEGAIMVAPLLPRKTQQHRQRCVCDACGIDYLLFTVDHYK
jgi:hypothetical protein